MHITNCYNNVKKVFRKKQEGENNFVIHDKTLTSYIMSVSEWLGPLTFVRIWHDSSGKGKNQGWYLSKVIVTDLQTGET
jgi:uncharacterized Tic20 family protein